MRCYCCNEILSPSETRTKFKGSGTFAETCKKCLETMDTPVFEVDDSFEDEDIISLDELQEQEDAFDPVDEEMVW